MGMDVCFHNPKKRSRIFRGPSRYFPLPYSRYFVTTRGLYGLFDRIPQTFNYKAQIFPNLVLKPGFHIVVCEGAFLIHIGDATSTSSITNM